MILFFKDNYGFQPKRCDRKVNMKNLIIHIGHGKTGSSYLQSLLALNKEFLLNWDINYPYHNSFEKAKKGFISSGNGENILKKDVSKYSTNTMLFSSESLFETLIDHPRLECLSKKYSLTIIVYTKNIVDLLVSIWEQGVKRGGLTEDVDTYLKRYKCDFYKNLIRWKRKSEYLGFNIIIRNYSIQRTNLISDFFHNCLNIELDINHLSFPKQKIINRGMTHSEYEIQRLFNHLIGKNSHRIISDYLVNNFPNVSAKKTRIKSQTFEQISKSYLHYIEEINLFLDSKNKLILGSPQEWIEDNNTFMDDIVLLKLSENIKKHLIR